MIVMLPSGAMLTQGESALPVRSLANVAARASGPFSTKANDSPAAPIITWRREIDVLFKDVMAIFVVMARPPARRAQPRARCVDRFRSGRDSRSYARRSARVSAWDSAGASQAFCSGCDESADSPSIVVTDLPAISETWVWHENARLPSICTMQAPHRPVPQPNLVPASFSPSLITHNNGVAGGASVDAALPFTVKVVVIFSSLQIDEDARWAWQMTAIERLSSMPAASIASKKGSARPAWRLSDQATPLTSVRGRGPCVIFRLRTLCA